MFILANARMFRAWLIVLLLFSHVRLVAQSSTHFAFEAALRGNSSRYSDESVDQNSTIEPSLDYGFGVSILRKFNPTTALRFGMLYTQRGLSISAEKDGTMLIDHAFEYLDFPITIQQYFFTAGGEKTLHPFLSLGVIPGFLTSEEPYYVYEVFNFTLCVGIGVDIPLSREVSIDVSLGYEYGLTDQYIQGPYDSDLYRYIYAYLDGWNTIYGSVKILFMM